ncbi:MAG: TonB-dependent receptor [Cyclobacteriaceae bacterium]
MLISGEDKNGCPVDIFNIVRCFSFVLSCVLSISLHAQIDTVYLDSLIVPGFAYPKFATGATVSALPTENMANLDQSITSIPGIYFKQYGNGQLATISFRGTDASHTNVLWHGLPTNSPSLGQTDFSLWSTGLIDHLGVQAGSGGTLYGSGSIGGTVFIDHFQYFKRNKLKIELEQSSFGGYKGNLKGHYFSGKWTGATAIIGSKLENNFPYKLKGTDLTQQQVNAEIIAYGLKQTLQFQHKNHTISGDFILLRNDREIQPSITNLSGNDHMLFNTVKGVLDYTIDLPLGSWSNTLGVFKEHWIYNDSLITLTGSNSFSTKFTGEKSGWLFTAGSLINHATASSNNYAQQEKLIQVDLFANLKRVIGKTTLSAGHRQALNSLKQPAIAPTFGIKQQVVSNRNIDLYFKSQYAAGFRIPTLNDLYWQPGGNHNLKPEKSHNFEGGFDLTLKTSHLQYSGNITVFATRSTHWILWTPVDAGFWSPENIRKVHIHGLETHHNLTATWNRATLQTSISGSVQQSLNMSDYPSSSLVGNQLPYVPKLSGYFANRLTWGSWSAELANAYTGLRYTSLDNTAFASVPAFFITNCSTSYSFKAWKVDSRVTARVNNIFNTYYENLINRAMPGINYQIQLSISL